MQLTFIGADHEVTGSCHFVSCAGKNFLVDCGMQQGPETYENQDIPVDAAKIDYVFVTHAHIDHSGLLPLLYAHGFRGVIFATQATCELCNIMLKDSAHIQESEAEWRNRKAKRSGKQEVVPLYTMDDAVGVLDHFVSVAYYDRVDVCDGISVRFVDAGHLLGSASIEIWLQEGGEERKIVFSGDIGNPNKPLVKNPDFLDSADYVLMESTYGDRDHKDIKNFAAELARLIDETLYQKGGNLVIPAFSVGRTQEILYFIRHIKEEHLMPGKENFPVYMDSPLAVEATHIFHANIKDCFDEEALRLVNEGRNPIGFAGLKVAVTSDESKMINADNHPKVIISASGMCEAGRIRHHLKHNLWGEANTILFVGYQVKGTLGYALLNGEKEVRLFGETVSVNARIENIPGISGHADRRMLMRWIGAFCEPPKKTFIVHGDDAVVDELAKAVTELTGGAAYAPYSGDSFDLITGRQIAVGSKLPREHKKKNARPASNVFARLLAAVARLTHLAQESEGMANKDLAKFADQINALSDKWEK